LQNIHDLERLMGRLASRSANARDLAALRSSLHDLPAVGILLKEMKSPANMELYRTYDDLADIFSFIASRIVENPPHATREGGMIRSGVDPRLDEVRNIRSNAALFVSQMEAREREQTGIASLKIKNNRVFGYYIEVTAANLSKVPAHYHRKQTIANGERFITDELKQLEETILGADDEINALEYDLFDAARRETVEQIVRVQFTAMALATLDTFQSLAEAADRNRYTRPAVDNGKDVYIKEGRHPVLEGVRSLELGVRSKEQGFVPNDTGMDGDSNRLFVITGPNMSGKST
jgi:DNA mismatch repair protein MutS